MMNELPNKIGRSNRRPALGLTQSNSGTSSGGLLGVLLDYANMQL
jgi:hypothetical protein